MFVARVRLLRLSRIIPLGCRYFSEVHRAKTRTLNRSSSLSTFADPQGSYPLAPQAKVAGNTRPAGMPAHAKAPILSSTAGGPGGKLKVLERKGKGSLNRFYGQKLITLHFCRSARKLSVGSTGKSCREYASCRHACTCQSSHTSQTIQSHEGPLAGEREKFVPRRGRDANLAPFRGLSQGHGESLGQLHDLSSNCKWQAREESASRHLLDINFHNFR